MDAIVVLAVVGLFAAGWAFVRLSDRLRDHTQTGR
jgi:hypothetical protein